MTYSVYEAFGMGKTAGILNAGAPPADDKAAKPTGAIGSSTVSTISSAANPPAQASCCDSIYACFKSVGEIIAWPFIKVYEWVLSLFGWNTNIVERFVKDPQAVVKEFIAKPDAMVANVVNEALSNPEKFADSLIVFFKDMKAAETAKSDKYEKALAGIQQNALEFRGNLFKLFSEGTTGEQMDERMGEVFNTVFELLGDLLPAERASAQATAAELAAKAAKLDALKLFFPKDSVAGATIEKLSAAFKDKEKTEALLKALNRVKETASALN